MISLIVTTISRGASLARLLHSLAIQDNTDFEVIVVDQNKTDELRSACDAPWPFHVMHLHTPEARGACRGRNAGLKHARGGIIVFPDDDCWYPVGFLSKGLLLMSDTTSDFVSGRAVNICGHSINGRYNTSAQRITRSNVWTSGIEWMVFWKRSVLDTTGGFDTEIGPGATTPWQAAEGVDLMLKALEKGYQGFFSPSLYGYHLEFDVELESLADGKGRRYGRGAGHVLRIHHYGFLSAVKWIGRPLIGAALSIIRGKFRRAQYYKNVCIGRAEGLAGKVIG